MRIVWISDRSTPAPLRALLSNFLNTQIWIRSIASGTYTADSDLTDVRYGNGAVEILESDKTPKSDDYVLNTTKTSEYTGKVTAGATVPVADPVTPPEGYRIEYYLENANDDGFTQDINATVTGSTYVGTTLDITADQYGILMKSYPHFHLERANS